MHRLTCVLFGVKTGFLQGIRGYHWHNLRAVKYAVRMGGTNLKDRDARSVGELMSESGSGFGRILQRARTLDQLNSRIMPLLEPKLASHCRVANVRDGRLVFVCSSPSCATRLRLQSPELIERLHALGMEAIEGIVVRITHDRSGSDP